MVFPVATEVPKIKDLKGESVKDLASIDILDAVRSPPSKRIKLDPSVTNISTQTDKSDDGYETSSITTTRSPSPCKTDLLAEDSSLSVRDDVHCTQCRFWY